MTKERWLDARKSELLPVEYFHKVFTLPHELNNLILTNKRVILDILFKTVAETLLSFGQDPRSRLGGKVGFTLILHTWNQQLLDHFHLHCVIPAGGLAPDGQSWLKNKNPHFLFSVKALGLVFRGKFLAALSTARDEGRLIFPGSVAGLATPQCFDALIGTLRSKEWVVYSKAPFGGPERVLEYLGRYTHRVAISNHRIQDVTEDSVAFSYRDRADGNKPKTTKLSGPEFVRRFLLHVLPSGFVRIRHYGFLASRNKKKMLAKCRESLGVNEPPIFERKTSEALLLEKCGINVLLCPHCKVGHMTKVESIFDKRFVLRSTVVSITLDTS